MVRCISGSDAAVERWPTGKRMVNLLCRATPVLPRNSGGGRAAAHSVTRAATVVALTRAAVQERVETRHRRCAAFSRA